MPVIEIPLGEWLPDSQSFKNPGCEVADNVIPSTGGYKPFPSLVAQGDTVTGMVKGARQLFDTNGNSIIVGGTDDRLFIRRTGITETTGLTSLGDGEAWDFAQFNDIVYATGANNSPQYLTDIDSDSTWSAAPGTPPIAKRCAKVGEFLMLGNTSNGENWIEWSSFNNPAGDWAASRLTQAGSAVLPQEFGPVQKIVGGRSALVFQDRGITRLSYVGPPVVWRADTISQDRGTTAPFSVVTAGYFSYFLAQDGFYVTNGTAIEPIGTQRVNRWFFDNVAQARIKEVQGAVDWQNESIVWAFPSNTSDGYDRAIIYSFAQNRWSTATIATDWLVGSTLDGLSPDDMDAIYPSVDAMTISMDSDEFKAKDRRLAAFVSSGATSEYSTFTGDALVALWETGEFQPSPHQRVFVSEVTPVFAADNWDAEITLLLRDNRGALVASKTVTTGWAGFAAVRGEAQKMAVRISKPSGVWSEGQAAQVRFKPAGYR